MAIITVQPSGGDFTTLAAALSDSGTTPNDIIEISGDWTSTTDTSAATVADNNITIRTKSGDQARHAGVDNEGSNYELAVDDGTNHCITINNTGCIIDGLIIKQDGTGTSAEGIRFARNNGTFTVKNTIVWADTQDDSQDGIYFANIDVTCILEQIYVYGFGRGGLHAQNFSGSADYTITVNSCGFWNNGDASVDAGGIALDSTGTGGTKTVDIHNTWSLDNDASFEGEDYHEIETAGGATWGISFSIDSDNSIASRDSGGTGNLASRTLRDATTGGDEVLVVDITTAPYDLTLIDDATNNDAQDAHTTATAEGLTILSTDIAGTSRPQNTSHDIGPFEVVAAAAADPLLGGLALLGVGR